jgi:hypothetical protein
MKKMDAAQTQRIITVGGLTRLYKLERGCRQGETLSCYRWNFFVDPLCEWLEMVVNQIGYNCDGIMINNVTFADDFTLFASSNAMLRILLGMQNAFFNIHGVRISAAKSLYSYVQTEPDGLDSTTRTLEIVDPYTHTRAPVQIVPPDEAFRVLGAYFSVSLNWKPQIEILQDWLDTTLARMTHMRAPLNMAVYVMNAAVITHILYPLQVAAVPQMKIEQWDKQIASTVKKMGGIASSTSTSLLYLAAGHLGAGLSRIATQLKGNLLFNLQLRLAENQCTTSSRLAFAQIRWYQQQRSLPYFPLFFSSPPPKTGNPYKSEIMQRIHTIMLQEGVVGRCNDKSFLIAPLREYDLPLVAAVSHSVYNLMYKQLATRGLSYVGDVLEPDGKRVKSWASIRDKGESINPPQWYKRLLIALTDSELPAVRNPRVVCERVSEQVSSLPLVPSPRLPPNTPLNDPSRTIKPYLYPPVDTTFVVTSLKCAHPSDGQLNYPLITLASDGAAKMFDLIPRAGAAVVDEQLLTCHNHGRTPFIPDWKISMRIAGTYPHHIIRVYAAEMWGLLAAACTAPDKQVLLYMDNQSIIDKLARLIEYNPIRSMVKQPMHPLWRCILTALDARTNPLTVQKTPSHSSPEQGGRKGNDAADISANQAMGTPTDPDDTEPIDNASHSPPDAPCGTYYGDLPLEFFELYPTAESKIDCGRIHGPITEYVNDNGKASAFEQWANRASQGRLAADPLAIGFTESPAAKEFFKYHSAFLIKLATDTLPTVTKLAYRSPVAFPNRLCPNPACKAAAKEESLHHLLAECPRNSDPRLLKLVALADVLAQANAKEELLPPSLLLPPEKLLKELQLLDPQGRYPGIFLRGDAKYAQEGDLTAQEGDTTVIHINTMNQNTLPRLQCTIRESIFWQLVKTNTEIKKEVPTALPFIPMLLASLDGYQEGNITVTGRTVLRDWSYWAARPSLLRIFVSELGLDTELYSSLLNSFRGFTTHYSIIQADKNWGFKMNALAADWAGIFAYAHLEYRKEDVRLFAEKCQRTLRAVKSKNSSPTRIVSLIPDGPVFNSDGTPTGEQWCTRELVESTGGKIHISFPPGAFPFLSSEYFDGNVDCNVSPYCASQNTILIAIWQNESARTGRDTRITTKFENEMNDWIKQRTPLKINSVKINNTVDAAEAYLLRIGMQIDPENPKSESIADHHTNQRVAIKHIKSNNMPSPVCPCCQHQKIFALHSHSISRLLLEHGVVKATCPFTEGKFSPVTTYEEEWQITKLASLSTDHQAIVWNERIKSRTKPPKQLTIRGPVNWFRLAPYLQWDWLRATEADPTILKYAAPGITSNALLAGIDKLLSKDPRARTAGLTPPAVLTAISSQIIRQARKKSKSEENINEKKQNRQLNILPDSDSHTILPLPLDKNWAQLRKTHKEQLSLVGLNMSSDATKTRELADLAEHECLLQTQYRQLTYDNGFGMPPTGWSRNLFEYSSCKNIRAFAEKIQQTPPRNFFETVCHDRPRCLVIKARINHLGKQRITVAQLEQRVLEFMTLMLTREFPTAPIRHVTSAAITPEKISIRVLFRHSYFVNFDEEKKFILKCFNSLNTATLQDDPAAFFHQLALRANFSCPTHCSLKDLYMIDFSATLNKPFWKTIYSERLGSNNPFHPFPENDENEESTDALIQHMRTYIEPESEQFSILNDFQVKIPRWPADTITDAPLSRVEAAQLLTALPKHKIDRRRISPLCARIIIYNAKYPRLTRIKDKLDEIILRANLAIYETRNDWIHTEIPEQFNAMRTINTAPKPDKPPPQAKRVPTEWERIQNLIEIAHAKRSRETSKRIEKKRSLNELHAPDQTVVFTTQPDLSYLIKKRPRGPPAPEPHQTNKPPTPTTASTSSHQWTPNCIFDEELPTTWRDVCNHFDYHHHDADGHCAVSGLRRYGVGQSVAEMRMSAVHGWRQCAVTASNPQNTTAVLEARSTLAAITSDLDLHHEVAINLCRRPCGDICDASKKALIKSWEHDDDQFLADYERFLNGNGHLGMLDLKYIAAHIKRRITVVWRVNPSPFSPLTRITFCPEYHISGLTPPITLVLTDERNSGFPNSLHRASPHYDSVSLHKSEAAPSPIFAVMLPPSGHTNQGPVWLQELSFPYATRPQDLVSEGKTRNTVWRQSTTVGEIMYRTRTWIWSKCQTAKSFSGVSDPHPECSDEDEMEFTPTNEVLDYRASQLHYLPPEKYLLVQSDIPRALEEKIFADGRQKKYPPLPMKETHIVVTNFKAMKALTKENLLKAPLPTSVFPSYRTIKNIGDLEHRKCDNCGRKKKCEILCDGPKCNKGYCLKCLGFKTVPKRLLHWNTEADKPKISPNLPTAPRYRPFFAKFCHPISEVDLPVTSNVRFVEKTVQKRPRKTKATSGAPPPSALDKSKKQKKTTTPSAVEPPTGATDTERTVRRATSTAQRWIRDNTSLTCLPSIIYLPTVAPNSLGIQVQLTPNTLIKCPLVKHSTHRTPKFRATIFTATNEILIKCLFGKCSSPPIKINIPPPTKTTMEQTKRARSPSPNSSSQSNASPPLSPLLKKKKVQAKRARSSSPVNPQPNTTSSSSPAGQRKRKKQTKGACQRKGQGEAKRARQRKSQEEAKRARHSTSPIIPQSLNRCNPHRQCRNRPCTPYSTMPSHPTSSSPCPSICSPSNLAPDFDTNPPVPPPLPTDSPPP